MAATMADVATLSGVSSSTVSHVLNGTRHVSSDTRARVEQAVNQLGYRRNPAARTLAGGSSRTIGLAISGLTNPYFGPLLLAIERHVSAAGYVFLLGDTHDEADMEHRVIESLLERRIDGLIIAPSNRFLERSAQLVQREGVPVVFIDRGLQFACDQLTPENSTSTQTLTTHLIEHGHRRIAAVVGLAGLDSTRERELGYRAALAHNGIEVDDALILSGESSEHAAEQAVTELLNSPHPPDALISLNNAMTIGALRAAQRAKLRIPEDLAFASYDDFAWSDIFHPGLTAIAQDVTRMGTEAVDVLLSRIGGNTRPFEHRVIDTHFHLRTSCGCAN